MQILHLRPLASPGSGRFRDVAEFDVEIHEGLRLNGLRLSLARDGKRFVFSPSKHGLRFATLNGDFARTLADAAFAELGGRVANDRT